MSFSPAAITEQTTEFLLVECLDECPHLCIRAAWVDRFVEAIAVEQQKRHADRWAYPRIRVPSSSGTHPLTLRYG